MLPFVLYFVTSVVTGFQVYTLLALSVYGVAVNPLELVALSGSFCLLIAACISLFRPQPAARLALVAALAISCFYGPAIAKVVRTRLGRRSVLTQFVSPRPAGQSNTLTMKWKSGATGSALGDLKTLGSEPG
jgi:hypothetical protein